MGLEEKIHLIRGKRVMIDSDIAEVYGVLTQQINQQVKMPLAFTQEGVAALSGILNSPRAIEANIAIMRAFVRMREILAEYRELRQRLDALESRYDGQFSQVFEAIRQLMDPPMTPRKQIGFDP